MTSTTKIIFFWKVTEPYGFCSQWYHSPFEVDGKTFPTAEHFMMYRKAMLFGDETIAQKILECKDLRHVKDLGRSVSRFDQKIWKKHREEIVYEGTYNKFIQNKELMKKLLSERNACFVEASPYDNIWGIGYNASSATKNRSTWGLNLLGKALNRVRDECITTDMSLVTLKK